MSLLRSIERTIGVWNTLCLNYGSQNFSFSPYMFLCKIFTGRQVVCVKLSMLEKEVTISKENLPVLLYMWAKWELCKLLVIHSGWFQLEAWHYTGI